VENFLVVDYPMTRGVGPGGPRGPWTPKSKVSLCLVMPPRSRGLTAYRENLLVLLLEKIQDKIRSVGDTQGVLLGYGEH
jgi:hypothetical protein